MEYICPRITYVLGVYISLSNQPRVLVLFRFRSVPIQFMNIIFVCAFFSLVFFFFFLMDSTVVNHRQGVHQSMGPRHSCQRVSQQQQQRRRRRGRNNTDFSHLRADGAPSFGRTHMSGRAYKIFCAHYVQHANRQ
jgi:hypothetical protein